MASNWAALADRLPTSCTGLQGIIAKPAYWTGIKVLAITHCHLPRNGAKQEKQIRGCEVSLHCSDILRLTAPQTLCLPDSVCDFFTKGLATWEATQKRVRSSSAQEWYRVFKLYFTKVLQVFVWAYAILLTWCKVFLHNSLKHNCYWEPSNKIRHIFGKPKIRNKSLLVTQNTLSVISVLLCSCHLHLCLPSGL